MAQPQTDPIIDLTTPRKRTVIKMDSGTYRFRSPFDLTIAETTKVERLMPRFLELALKGHTRTLKEGEELGTLSAQVCAIGLLEGDAKTAGPSGCVVLADFFFDLCLQTNQRLGQVRESMVGASVEAITQAIAQAGARPSHASSGSTKGSRAPGSKRRR